MDTSNGFTTAQADDLRRKWGFNELPEKKVCALVGRAPLPLPRLTPLPLPPSPSWQVNIILMFLSYFWGPMPCMIWVAIIIELVKGIISGEGA